MGGSGRCEGGEILEGKRGIGRWEGGEWVAGGEVVDGREGSNWSWQVEGEREGNNWRGSGEHMYVYSD